MVPRYIVALLAALLLAACAPKKSPVCASVECRPQSGDYSLTIWWQPDLRNGPTDYTQVQVTP